MGTSFCTKAAFVISGLIALGAGTLNAQSVEIARWKNNATAAYSIIMDDYATQYFGDVAHIDSTLANRNLGVSFATIPNWAECTGGCLKGAFGRAQTLFKNSEWINHSWAHSNTTAEDNALNFDQAKAKIEEGIPGNKCLVFAYPSTMNFSDRQCDYYV